MDLTGFNDEQKRTLLDLLVVGMYADGYLADNEDEEINRILDAIEFPSESARDHFLDAAFTRARQHLGSASDTREFVAAIASHFPTPEIRQKVYDHLKELLSSDHQLVDKECRLLLMVKDEFKL